MCTTVRSVLGSALRYSNPKALVSNPKAFRGPWVGVRKEGREEGREEERENGGVTKEKK
jgi:hypothetical protein